jgi:DNA-binding XRE family transcriptional regulator
MKKNDILTEKISVPDGIFPYTEKEAGRLGITGWSDLNKEMHFPKAMRELRSEKGYTQQQVADSIGVTKSTIGLYENGDNIPDIKTLYKISKLYKVPPEYLLNLSKSKSIDDVDRAFSEKTGLSDGAINELEFYNDFDMVELFNYLIENEEFKGFMVRLNNLLMYQGEYSKEELRPEKYHVSQYDTAKYAVISYFDKLIDDIYTNRAVEYCNYRNSTAHEREERWARAREQRGGNQNGK